MFPGVFGWVVFTAWAGPASARTLAASATVARTKRARRVGWARDLGGFSCRSTVLSPPQRHRMWDTAGVSANTPIMGYTDEGYKKCGSGWPKQLPEAEPPGNADGPGIGGGKPRIEPEE